MSIDITVNAKSGDVSGIKKIEEGYQSLVNKTKQAYQSLQKESPMQIIADRQAQRRQMTELDRKATQIEQKIARTKLGQLEDGTTEAGTTNLAKLRTDLEKTNLQRQITQSEMRVMPTPIRQVMGAGRFVGGKVLRYGGAIAGIAGAYGLFSGIAERMETSSQKEQEYATAIMQSGGLTGMGFGERGAFFGIEKVLEKLGETVLATSKDILPLIGTAKELGDLMGGTQGFTGKFARTVNLAKMMGVDTSVLNQLYMGGIRGGGFTDPEQMQLMSQALIMNPNMAFRGNETLQAFQQMMSGTVGGTQQLGGFGMFNLMNTLNQSPFLAYRGAGGAQAMLGINQAFTGGGNQNLEYFQAMALNPAFQDINARRLSEYNALPGGGPTNYGTGRYDQLIADVFKELGAFATAGDVQGQLSKMGFKGAAAYVGSSYADPNKMNIQRLFEQYRGAYGAKDEGRRFLMTAQMSKDLGVSFSDVGVLNRALQDPEFLKLAKEAKLDPEAMAGVYDKFKTGGKRAEVIAEYAKAQADKEIALQSMADSIKKMATKLLPDIVIGLDLLAENLPILTEAIVDFVKFFTRKKTITPPGKVLPEDIPIIETVTGGLMTVDEKGQIIQTKTKFGLPKLPGVGTFKREPPTEEAEFKSETQNQQMQNITDAIKQGFNNVQIIIQAPGQTIISD
jgi:hypothetical protein